MDNQELKGLDNARAPQSAVTVVGKIFNPIAKKVDNLTSIVDGVLDKSGSGGTQGDSKLPPKTKPPKPSQTAPKKSRICVDSAGVANAMNFQKAKAGKKRTERDTYSSIASKQDGKVLSVVKRLSSKPKNVLSLLPQSSPPTAPNTNKSGQVVKMNSTAYSSTTTPAQNVCLITECATTWSIIGFGITSLYTGTHFIFARSGDKTFIRFYAWILLPICITAMVISFGLKPRRENLIYKTFIYAQYVLLAFVSEILYMVGYNWQEDAILNALGRCLFSIFLFFFALRVRARVAKLSDEDLSCFLSQSVVRGGLVIGLAQLAFLAFSSLQCESEAR